MNRKSVIATAISEIRGDMSDKEFADVLSIFTQGQYQPSPNTIQKYRTGQREPNYTDLQTILAYGSANKKLSVKTSKMLADFFYIKKIDDEVSQIAENNQEEIYQIADLAQQIKKTSDITKKADLYRQKERLLEEVLEQSFQSGESLSTMAIPILGSVPAGYPLTVEENINGYISMPRSMMGNADYFFLIITGESMKDAGVQDGDLVLVRKSNIAEDGQMVIARVDGQDVTCKKFYRTSEGIILLPANTEFQPIKTTDIQIIGIVEKVMKNF